MIYTFKALQMFLLNVLEEKLLIYYVWYDINIINATFYDFDFQSTMNYLVVGNGLAPGAFRIADQASGEVTIAADLRRDNALSYNVSSLIFCCCLVGECCILKRNA